MNRFSCVAKSRCSSNISEISQQIKNGMIADVKSMIKTIKLNFQDRLNEVFIPKLDFVYY